MRPKTISKFIIKYLVCKIHGFKRRCMFHRDDLKKIEYCVFTAPCMCKFKIYYQCPVLYVEYSQRENCGAPNRQPI